MLHAAVVMDDIPHNLLP